MASQRDRDGRAPRWLGRRRIARRQRRRQDLGGAGAHRFGVEPHNEGRQQANQRQHRVAPAECGIVIEHHEAESRGKVAQGIVARLAHADEMIADLGFPQGLARVG